MGKKRTGNKAGTRIRTSKQTERPKIKNRIAVLLDRSASMRLIETPAVRAFNERVKAIHTASKKEAQETTVTLITFGGDERPGMQFEAGRVPGSQVRLEHFNADPASMRPIERLGCGGNTPMLSAIRRAVELFQALPEAGDPNVSFLVEVVTDGEENSSHPTTKEEVARLMREVSATDRWTFVFSVPRGHYKGELCRQFGIPEDCVQEWDATAGGVELSTCSTVLGYGSYFAARSAGTKAVTNFFVTDLSKVRASAVKKKLWDLSAHVKAWEVEREVPIREFVESKNRGAYVLGAAYYQLTKPETVQPHKAVLVMEKGKPAVYGGPEARALLGLSGTGDARVTPGNHANYDVFVQSKSVNRKLVRGTRLLYRTDLHVPSQPTW